MNKALQIDNEYVSMRLIATYYMHRHRNRSNWIYEAIFIT